MCRGKDHKLRRTTFRKLPFEVAFNILATERDFCVGQQNRIHDLISCKLRGDKCPVFRQFLVDEFHHSAVCKCFDPLLVWHFRGSLGEVCVYGEHILFGYRSRGSGMKPLPLLSCGGISSFRWLQPQHTSGLCVAPSAIHLSEARSAPRRRPHMSDRELRISVRA
jgi:hypothetical protein